MITIGTLPNIPRCNATKDIEGHWVVCGTYTELRCGKCYKPLCAKHAYRDYLSKEKLYCFKCAFDVK